jgi:hypothetical protein
MHVQQRLKLQKGKEAAWRKHLNAYSLRVVGNEKARLNRVLCELQRQYVSVRRFSKVTKVNDHKVVRIPKRSCQSSHLGLCKPVYRGIQSK